VAHRPVTFLGGEPTLHPRFSDALRLAQDEGYETRIVTNGHFGYQKFLSSNGARERPFVCFSVDGSVAAVHDAIRGKGTFAVLLDSINKTRAAGYRIGGIVAICRENSNDVRGIVSFCHEHNFEYVNIHYVTNRGLRNERRYYQSSSGRKP
jgi:MoaA/NifB/PqqE/SkfB family radical SAM enzyme